MTNSNAKKFVQNFKSSESTISMLLGVVVVVIVGVLLVKYFKNSNVFQQISSVPDVQQEVKTEESNVAKTDETLTKKAESTKVSVPENVSLPTVYEVQKNDSLWKISQKFYGTGYAWVKISQANKLSNPGVLFVGTKLTIPEIRTEKIAQTENNNQTISQGSITGNSYTVVKGDTLWKISVRAYQDGFKWTQIAKANNLINPAKIHPGNVLTIPR